MCNSLSRDNLAAKSLLLLGVAASTILMGCATVDLKTHPSGLVISAGRQQAALNLTEEGCNQRLFDPAFERMGVREIALICARDKAHLRIQTAGGAHRIEVPSIAAAHEKVNVPGREPLLVTVAPNKSFGAKAKPALAAVQEQQP